MDTILSADATPAIPPADLIKESTTADFPVDVMEASKQVPVLVDFWAPWCGPCRQLGPAIEKVVTEAGGKVKLVKINVDENQALAGQMGVRSIPAVFAFSGGQPVDGFMGALPESEIKRFVEKQIAGAGDVSSGESEFDTQLKAVLETAEQALEQGELQQAAEIYAMILQQVPDNIDALLGLADVQVRSGQLVDARELLGALSEEAQASEKYAAVLKAIELAEEAEKLGDAGELLAKLEADPTDHQTRLDLAVILNQRGDRLAAAEQLVTSIRKDRDWNEGAAKAKLLELFEAWGPTDPASIKGRRLLSAVLFS